MALERDAYYTRKQVSIKYVGRALSFLEKEGVDIDDCDFFELSAGGGAFVDALLERGVKEENIIAIDICPQHRLVKRKSFYDFNPRMARGRKRVLIGNPPFGKRSRDARNFVILASRWADFMLLILPYRMCSAISERSVTLHCLYHMEDVPPNAFEDPDGKVMNVPCQWTTWRKESNKSKVFESELGPARFSLKTIRPNSDPVIINKEYDCFLDLVSFGNAIKYIEDYERNPCCHILGFRLSKGNEYLKEIIKSKIDWLSHAKQGQYTKTLSVAVVRRVLMNNGGAENLGSAVFTIQTTPTIADIFVLKACFEARRKVSRRSFPFAHGIRSLQRDEKSIATLQETVEAIDWRNWDIKGQYAVHLTKEVIKQAIASQNLSLARPISRSQRSLFSIKNSLYMKSFRYAIEDKEGFDIYIRRTLYIGQTKIIITTKAISDCWAIKTVDRSQGAIDLLREVVKSIDWIKFMKKGQMTMSLNRKGIENAVSEFYPMEMLAGTQPLF